MASSVLYRMITAKTVYGGAKGRGGTIFAIGDFVSEMKDKILHFPSRTIIQTAGRERSVVGRFLNNTKLGNKILNREMVKQYGRKLSRTGRNGEQVYVKKSSDELKKEVTVFGSDNKKVGEVKINFWGYPGNPLAVHDITHNGKQVFPKKW